MEVDQIYLDTDGWMYTCVHISPDFYTFVKHDGGDSLNLSPADAEAMLSLFI